MFENLYASLLLKRLHRLLSDIPEQYRVKISVTDHFMHRVAGRADKNLGEIIFTIAEIIEANYPLILYYAALDVLPPNHGELEHSKYGIRGNVINGQYVLQTFFIKGVDHGKR